MNSIYGEWILKNSSKATHESFITQLSTTSGCSSLKFIDLNFLLWPTLDSMYYSKRFRVLFQQSERMVMIHKSRSYSWCDERTHAGDCFHRKCSSVMRFERILNMRLKTFITNLVKINSARNGQMGRFEIARSSYRTSTVGIGIYEIADFQNAQQYVVVHTR